MEMNPEETPKTSAKEAAETSKKVWETPAFVSESTDVTRGGPSNPNDQDDIFYVT
jgi:hypothetical protein